jgi:hypothetical protein
VRAREGGEREKRYADDGYACAMFELLQQGVESCEDAETGGHDLQLELLVFVSAHFLRDRKKEKGSACSVLQIESLGGSE